MEQAELRKVIRQLCKLLEELLWISYGSKLSEEDLAVVADCKALVKRCEYICRGTPGPEVQSWKQTDHRAAATPNGAHTDDAGTN